MTLGLCSCTIGGGHRGWGYASCVTAGAPRGAYNWAHCSCTAEASPVGLPSLATHPTPTHRLVSGSAALLLQP